MPMEAAKDRMGWRAIRRTIIRLGWSRKRRNAATSRAELEKSAGAGGRIAAAGASANIRRSTMKPPAEAEATLTTIAVMKADGSTRKIRKGNL